MPQYKLTHIDQLGGKSTLDNNSTSSSIIIYSQSIQDKPQNIPNGFINKCAYYIAESTGNSIYVLSERNRIVVDITPCTHLCLVRTGSAQHRKICNLTIYEQQFTVKKYHNVSHMQTSRQDHSYFIQSGKNEYKLVVTNHNIYGMTKMAQLLRNGYNNYFNCKHIREEIKIKKLV